jgi:predicted transcriptional regulator of viral defense system
MRSSSASRSSRFRNKASQQSGVEKTNGPPKQVARILSGCGNRSSYCGGMIVLEHAAAAFAGTGARSASRDRRNNKNPL